MHKLELVILFFLEPILKLSTSLLHSMTQQCRKDARFRFALPHDVNTILYKSEKANFLVSYIFRKAILTNSGFLHIFHFKISRLKFPNLSVDFQTRKIKETLIKKEKKSVYHWGSRLHYPILKG